MGSSGIMFNEPGSTTSRPVGDLGGPRTKGLPRESSTTTVVSAAIIKVRPLEQIRFLQVQLIANLFRLRDVRFQHPLLDQANCGILKSTSSGSRGRQTAISS